MKRLNPKRGGWKREGVVGGGFKGTRVGGGGESGSARPQTDGGQRWAPGAAHKGERRGPARVPGEEKTAPGPNPLGSHNGVFHGVSGGAAEADAGRRRRCPLAGAEPRAPPPPRTPKGPALGWGRSGRRRRVGARGARRLLVGPVCGSGARRRGRKGRARFGRGGRERERGGGSAAAKQPPGRLAREWRAGGRRWHRLREPRPLRSESRNRAPKSGSPALARGPPRPRWPRRSCRLLRPARARSLSGRNAEEQREQPRRRRLPLPRRRSERLPSRRGGLCVCECAALSPHAWHMRKSELRPKSQPYPP